MDQNQEQQEQGEKIEVEPIADEDTRIADPADKIKKLKSELERSEKERKEYLDGWQRAKADFVNYKKDEAKRVEEFVQFANAALVQEILPVLDSFDLALRIFRQPASGDQQQEEQGVLLIRSQLEDLLRKYGLESIEAKPGDSFDPERHEAIGEEESGFPSDSVASILQKGYALRGRILRPARVKLAKGRI